MNKIVLGALGILATVGVIGLVERCSRQRQFEGQGELVRGVIARHGATTTVLVQDSVKQGRRQSRQRLVAIDGVSGGRLATRGFQSGACEQRSRDGRVHCKIDSALTVLDARTLETLDEKIDEVYLEPTWSSGPPTCAFTSSIWLDGASWGFSGRPGQVFTKLPMEAEGSGVSRRQLYDPRLVQRTNFETLRSEAIRLDGDFLVQHHATENSAGDYLLSRMTLDGVVRWTVPLAGECSTIHADDERVIIVTRGDERALAIDSRFGVVRWRLRFPE